MPKLIYQYMIMFTYSHGTGRMELFRTKKIKTYDDVKSVDNLISEMNGFNCTVSDFKLLNVRIKKGNFFDTLNCNKSKEPIK